MQLKKIAYLLIFTSCSLANATTNTTSALNSDISMLIEKNKQILILTTLAKSAEKPELSQVAFEQFHSSIEMMEQLKTSYIKTADKNGYIKNLLNTVNNKKYTDIELLALKDLVEFMLDNPPKNGTSALSEFYGKILTTRDLLNKEVALSTVDKPRAAPRVYWDNYLTTVMNSQDVTKTLNLFKSDIDSYKESQSRSLKDFNIFGNNLASKQILLTFDDGPHPKYTYEIRQILLNHKAPALFFQVGKNLVNNSATATYTLKEESRTIDKGLLNSNFHLGNHSFSHAQLSKVSDTQLKFEINAPQSALNSLKSEQKGENVTRFFRFPYGAVNPKAGAIFNEHTPTLKSVLWNIDSLDWSDKVPASITNRVVAEAMKQGKGIVLFHDIHSQTVESLDNTLTELEHRGFSFVSPEILESSQSLGTESHPTNHLDNKADNASSKNSALIIAIDNYRNGWPKLSTAVSDANALKTELVKQQDISSDNVTMLVNENATRQAILDALDKYSLKQERNGSQLLVYFAGHGDTLTLNSGRKVGYIVPYDAVAGKSNTTAISMTDLQNVAENIKLKHVLFVMDSCYSGLAISRGLNQYTEENDTRKGLQILTAGGANQQVSDVGYTGNSMFTGYFLEGLRGLADTNKDGIITATELAAYIAPLVSKNSLQTPAFGNLAGSEGGDYVFKNPSLQLEKTEVLVNKELSTQLSQEALLQYKVGNVLKAKSLFKQAVAQNPKNIEAVNNLGFVYHKDKKYDEAIYWYDMALKLDKERYVTYVNLADSYFDKGDSKKAIELYKVYLSKVQQKDPSNYSKIKKDLEEALTKKGFDIN